MFFNGKEVKIFTKTNNLAFVAYTDDLDNTFNVRTEKLSATKKREIETKYAKYQPEVHDLPLNVESPFLQQLETFCINNGVMTLGCDPESFETCCSLLKEKGFSNPAGYLRVGGENSHGLWVNIDIPDPEIPEIDCKLHMFFNPYRKGFYQLAKSEFTHRLLGKMVVLEPQEKRGM